VAFRAGLAGAEFGNDLGIFLFDDQAGLTQLVREGDPLLGSTISLLELVSQQIDDRRVLNDLGDVAYHFTLADGRSGIAIARLVPEPGSAAMLVLGVLALPMIRERRLEAKRAAFPHSLL
jgi:hypothetical protein